MLVLNDSYRPDEADALIDGGKLHNLILHGLGLYQELPQDARDRFPGHIGQPPQFGQFGIRQLDTDEV